MEKKEISTFLELHGGEQIMANFLFFSFNGWTIHPFKQVACNAWIMCSDVSHVC